MKWKDAVRGSIINVIDSNGYFTLKQLKLNEIQKIIEKTKTKGKTPEQTLHRTLQELRDDKIIEFVNNNGYYKLNTQILQSIKILKNCLTINHLFIDINNKYQNNSYGEKLIKQCLEYYELKFKEQMSLSGLKFKNPLKFDFIIEHTNNKYKMFAIEFNGRQHYEPVKYFGGEKSFESQKIRDGLKQDYCIKNNIKLLIIHYSLINKIKFVIMKFLIENDLI